MVLSHESRILASLLLDYAICGSCCLIAFAIERIPPNQRVGFFGDLSINYPYKDESTIPGWTLPFVAFMVPSLFVLLIGGFRKRNLRYHTMSVLGLLLGVSLTYLITSILKVSVGKLRPDFKDRCKPSDVPSTDDKFGTILNCTGDKKIINEGRKSFPSGHTSSSFAGFAYSSLYIGYQLRLFSPHTFVLKTLFFIIPWIIAILVAVTRIFDNKHHFSDIFSGAVIGIIFAFFSFFLYFPALKKLAMEQAGQDGIILPPLPSPNQQDIPKRSETA
jgi:diacylglycerol diphosphate phosphatase/phosphatidate phosphatase